MKIGILTYHRTLNYGGCLQALATRLVLEEMGHIVYYVDYWPDYHKDSYSIFSFSSIRKAPTLASGIRGVIESIRFAPYIKQRQVNFKTFLENNILPFCQPISESYDVIIYGSDQIWRKQPSLNDYNPVYFGENDFHAGKHIAFSASMGIKPSDDDEPKKLKNLVSHLDRIAVREIELKEYLESIGYSDVELTIDPTLLLSFRLWDVFMPTSSYCGPKYMLVYALNDAFDMNTIRQFAKKKGLMVKVLLGAARHADTDTEIATAGPNEFIRLVKNAEFVFSSSFHGLAFSLIYGKEVFVSFKLNANRAKSLLAVAGIPERFLEPMSEIPAEFKPIDYRIVNKNLEALRELSLNYLKSI